MTRPRSEVALSAAVYIVVTAILGRAVLANLGGVILSDEGDPLFVAALLRWNATTLPLSEAWWQFPIFHPTPDAIAFSEHVLGLSPIATPLYWLTRDAVVTYNLTTLLTYPLCGLAMFALVYRLTRSATGAFLAGLAFAFSPYRVSQLPHAQMLASFWAPLALLGLHAYLDTGRRRWLALYGAAWMLQGAANGYALVFFSVLIGLWVLWFVAARRNWRALGMIALTTVLAILPLAPILIGYVGVHRLHGFSRDLAEIRFFSADLAALFCAPGHLTFWGWIRTACRPEGELFPGVALILVCVVAFVQVVARRPAQPTVSSRTLSLASRALLAVGLLYAVVVCVVMVSGPWRWELGPLRISASSAAKPIITATAAIVLAILLSPAVREAARRSSTLGFYLMAALVCWALALGPTIVFMGTPRGFDAPFSLLMYLPGADSLRVPARFWLMSQLCLSVAAGILAGALLNGRRLAVRASALALATCGLLADAWVVRMPVAAVPPPVPDERPLRGALVLELPTGSLRDIAAEFRAVTGDWRSINGYSGYIPSYYAALMDAVRAEDEQAFIPFLALDDLHVVVAADAPRLQAAVERLPGATVTARNERAVQYRVPRLKSSAALRMGEVLPIQSVQASCEVARAGQTIDRDDGTVWVCGPQRGGHDLVIDMGRAVDVGAVVQNLASRWTEFPRHLVIETSMDAAAWDVAWQGSVRRLLIEQAIARPEAALRIAVPIAPPRSARYIRLRQTASDEDLPWAVAELEIRSP